MGNENRIDLTPGIRCKERVGTATIAPGSALTEAAAGYGVRGAGTDNDPIIVALTAPERGKGINDNYVANETVRAGYVGMGQKANFILAASQTVAIGDDLAFAANGQVTQTGTNARLMAEEAVTTGAGETKLVSATPKQS